MVRADPQTQRSLPALPAKTVLPANAGRGRNSGKSSGLGRNAWIGIGGGAALLLAVVFFLSKGADPAPVEKQEIAVGKGGPSAAPARVKRLAKAEPNTLSAEEALAGWKLLFDGKTTAGWRNYKQPTIGPAWKTENGALARSAGAGDIVTAEQYDAFELSLEYKISKGGNSGVIYHVVEDGNQPWMSGPEVQILDNKDGVDPQKAGWLYQLYSTDKDATKPVGEWNELQIVITPEKCEHFMNGEKYVEYVIGSDDWNQRVAGCKFGTLPGYGKSPRGHICLQDHGNDVAFLGATWNSHHGKHGTQSTRGILAPGQSEHPILRGIQDGDIWGPTDVYGLALPLPGDSRPLVLGQVLAGMSAQDAPVEGKQNDPLMPVAWIKSYAAEGGKAGRVFTTTMGSSQDLQSEGFRRLVVNAAYWGLALEDKIPEKSNVDVVGTYEPTRFSFGGFVKGRKPDYAAD